ncbi:hypothetical protein CHUAL_009356 [Chamberlinius hualienensis]
MLKIWVEKLRDEIRLKLILYWLCTTIVTLCILGVINNTCTKAFVYCVMIAVTFVGSLYIWKENRRHFRDHPRTIFRRFISVTIASVFSLMLVILFANSTDYEGLPNGNVAHLLGIRFNKIVKAAVLPLILTMVLFLGPIVCNIIDYGLFNYIDNCLWYLNFSNWIWLRNHIMAPFSEEFSFRACMLPLLLNCYSHKSSIFICPIFFGIGHAHHLVERIIHREDIRLALITTVFQLIYTTIFGAYSAFLFLRTGHFIAPLVVHSFCNHMGFPSIDEIPQYSQPKRTIVSIAYVTGLLLWCRLLFPLTSPSLYENSIFWNNVD